MGARSSEMGARSSDTVARSSEGCTGGLLGTPLGSGRPGDLGGLGGRAPFSGERLTPSAEATELSSSSLWWSERNGTTRSVRVGRGKVRSAERTRHVSQCAQRRIMKVEFGRRNKTRETIVRNIVIFTLMFNRTADQYCMK